jgi:hypothetical protein
MMKSFRRVMRGAMPAPVAGAAGRSGSGRQAGPAARAAAGNHLAAALCGHARTETMAALADKLRGLKGALHGEFSNSSGLDDRFGMHASPAREAATGV